MQKIQNDIDRLKALFETTETLANVKDIEATLESILYEARRFTGADAGTIYLRHKFSLSFAYVQNQTLNSRDQQSRKYIYTKSVIPINHYSVAGWVAQTGKALNIDDVYNIGSDVPYRFNSDFDVRANYKTRSMLSVPLVGVRSGIIGVMQLINAKADNGEIVSFTDADTDFASYFARTATAAIERAKITREMILRMVRMAELRDPRETGSHVNRVGSYAVEIYRQWAKNHNVDAITIKHFTDNLRIAAMLHDVGKVAISDLILKKPASLDEDEFAAMKQHTVYGAELFANSMSEMDVMSAEIAITHHEKYDGSGYPAGLKGEYIPLAGRITALADVYDALVSARIYKPAWKEKDVLDLLQKERGRHFDPEVIDAFFEVYEIIMAVRNKYPDKD